MYVDPVVKSELTERIVTAIRQSVLSRKDRLPIQVSDYIIAISQSKDLFLSGHR